MDDRDLQEKLVELQDEVCIGILRSNLKKIISFLQSEQDYLRRSHSLPISY
jgi:hypothetical protein